MVSKALNIKNGELDHVEYLIIKLEVLRRNNNQVEVDRLQVYSHKIDGLIIRAARKKKISTSKFEHFLITETSTAKNQDLTKCLQVFMFTESKRKQSEMRVGIRDWIVEIHHW